MLNGAMELQLSKIIIKGETLSATRKFAFSITTTIASVFITSLLAWLLVYAGFPSPETLSILFVIPVLAVAVLYGLFPSLFSVIFSVLAYNFVLLSPIWHISLWEVENFAKAAVLTIVAIVASCLSKLLTHKYLMQQVWGEAYSDDNQYLRIYIAQLRQKLEKDPARDQFIINEPGIGYRLEEPTK